MCACPSGAAVTHRVTAVATVSRDLRSVLEGNTEGSQVGVEGKHAGSRTHGPTALPLKELGDPPVRNRRFTM
ncbi:hypothetical protein GCM10010252_62900 [Streptomyces aureoverticillatus]|nr:hypothetical protein GCM10010252_62900 [Streptomyces aureoverticillatus]